MILRPAQNLIITLVLFFPIVSWANTYYVNDNRDAIDADTSDNICETQLNNKLCTLRAAIIQANKRQGADVIIVPAGIYKFTRPPVSSIDLNGLEGDLDITDALRIQGAGVGQTIIDGGGLDRVFDITNSCFSCLSTVVISDLTIQNGSPKSSEPDGAGIRVSPWFFATLIRLQITDNHSNSANSDGGFGGGIYSEGNVMLIDSTVSNNSANFGGGIANTRRLNVQGSAIINNNSTKESDGATFSVKGGGGGIYNDGPNNIFSLIKVKLSNSTISGNQANDFGGGLFFKKGALEIDYVTFSNNASDANSTGVGIGHDIYAEISGAGATSPFLIANSILNSGINTNRGTDSRCLNISSLGHNIINNAPACSPITNNSSDLIANVTAPMDIGLAPLSDNGGATFTHSLLSSSPAIDFNPIGTCPQQDQRGLKRNLDGNGDGTVACDVGAIELAGSEGTPLDKLIFDVNSPLDLADADTSDGICEVVGNNGVCTLRAAIEQANALIDYANIIKIPAGEYVLNTVSTATGFLLNSTNNTQLIGDTATSTIINGNGIADNKVLQITGGGLSKLTIKGGNLGGIKVNGISVISHINVIDNGGTGIENWGNLNISDTTVANNQGTGIANRYSGYLLMSNSTINNNTLFPAVVESGLGAGIHNTGIMHINNITLSGNQVDGRGAAIYNDFSPGSYSYTMNYSSLLNVTVFNNTATLSDAAILVVSGSHGLLIHNSIIYSNLAPDPATSATIALTQFNVVANSSNITDLLDVSLLNNGGEVATHALLENSPAIDAGEPDACADFRGVPLSSDARGFTRNVAVVSNEARCDYGAYEMQSPLTAIITTTEIVTMGDTVELDASNSKSKFGISSYHWSQVGTEMLTINNFDQSSANFVAANVGNYTINLQLVDNQGNSAEAQVLIQVNSPPISDGNGTSEPANNDGGGSAFYLLLFCSLIMLKRVR